MRITSNLRPTPASSGPASIAFPATTLAAAPDNRIGALLVHAGDLTAPQVEQVARVQAASGERFGEAAVALGYTTPDRVERALARQFDFSVAHPGDSRLDPSLVVAVGGRDRSSELIRNLRAKLAIELAARGDEGRFVAALSTTAMVGRRVIAANLAIAFAQSGVRTLLVDADLRTPSLHRLFDAPSQAGLSSFLAGRQPRPTIVPITEIDNLAVHPAGPPPPNPAELLSRLPGQLAAIADAWNAGVVLFNTPPLATAEDGHLVAAATKNVLLVARRDFTRLKPLLAAQRRFVADGARVVGSVINASKRT